MVCMSSSEGHRRSFFGFVMDRDKGWQKVVAERSCDEHNQWDNLARPTAEHSIALAFDLDFKDAIDQSVEGSTRGRRNGDGVAMQVSCGLDSNSFRSYH
ncbi:hypothetical protein V6N13_030708 [Hibiscus sabdariffa]